MIKAVLWDLGEVLLWAQQDSICTRLETEYNLPAGSLSVFNFNYYNLAFRGSVKDVTEYWEREQPDLGVFKLEQAVEMRRLISASIEIDDQVLPLIKATKLRCKTAVVSNWEFGLELVLARLGLTSYFDAVVSSHDVKSVKPDQEIFLKAVRTLKIKPHEALFIDDKPENVEGARKLGVRGILYTGVEDLKKNLGELL